jgi:polar amino acid transport system substrate-binding protein
MRAQLFAAVVVLAWTAGVSGQRTSDVMSPAARRQLLPTGRLRVGINTGNQLTRVVGRAIAGEMARRLNTDAAFVEFPSPGATADAAGVSWDIAFIAADPDREAALAFTPPYVELEAAYLVAAASPLRSLADVDRPGVKIASGPTSAYTLVLKRELTHAELVLLSATDAAEALTAGSVHAIAGLRFDLMARAAGDQSVRVLPGAFARAQQAIAVPKANAAALAYVAGFLADLKRNGAIETMIRRTGLPGARAIP